MPHTTEALNQVRNALTSLTKARDALSAALLHHKGGKHEADSEYHQLLDLHKRVTQAATLLPHGGER